MGLDFDGLRDGMLVKEDKSYLSKELSEGCPHGNAGHP